MVFPPPKGYYRFNGNSQDASIENNHGSDSNITYVAGTIDEAASFNGSTSTIILSETQANTNIFDNGGTITAWINPDSEGENNSGFILQKNGIWQFRVGEQLGSDMKLVFSHLYSGSDGQWDTVVREIPITTWTHVAVVFNSNSDSIDPTLYVNGSSVSVEFGANPQGTRTSDAGGDMSVGNNAATSGTWNGLIDQLIFFNNALTQEQITSVFDGSFAAIYDLTLGRPATYNERDLKTEWPVDEGLLAGVNKQTGRRFLHPEGILGVKSVVREKEDWGFRLNG